RAAEVERLDEQHPLPFERRVLPRRPDAPDDVAEVHPLVIAARRLTSATSPSSTSSRSTIAMMTASTGLLWVSSVCRPLQLCATSTISPTPAPTESTEMTKYAFGV